MRLIDADALIKTLTYSPDGRRYKEVDCENFPLTLPIRDIKKMIREAPTIKEMFDEKFEKDKLANADRGKGKCEWDGCSAYAICGVTTKDGYKSLCIDHFHMADIDE